MIPTTRNLRALAGMVVGLGIACSSSEDTKSPAPEPPGDGSTDDGAGGGGLGGESGTGGFESDGPHADVDATDAGADAAGDVSGDAVEDADASLEAPSDAFDDPPGDSPSDTVVDKTAVPIDGAGKEDAPEIDAAVDGGVDSSSSGCLLDSDCLGQVAIGPCQQPSCDHEKCSATTVTDGTTCDDSDGCTGGDSCSAGVCVGVPDGTLPSCTVNGPGSLWITEVLGNPAPVAGAVDAQDGAWIELVNRSSAVVPLNGLLLAYYTWAVGGTEPTTPTPIVSSVQSTAALAGGEIQVIARADDGTLNSVKPVGLYGSIVFDDTLNARLIVLRPSWPGTLPASASDTIDSIVIPAGTFAPGSGDGRSWQLGFPLPLAPQNRKYCLVPVDVAYQYASDAAASDYGTPSEVNAACP